MTSYREQSAIGNDATDGEEKVTLGKTYDLTAAKRDNLLYCPFCKMHLSRNDRDGQDCSPLKRLVWTEGYYCGFKEPHRHHGCRNCGTNWLIRVAVNVFPIAGEIERK